MIITTRGRKRGLPRQTAVEFHEFEGHKYVASGYGARADWYKNILADSCVTIQTAQGAESVLARRISEDRELTILLLPPILVMMIIAGYALYETRKVGDRRANMPVPR